MAITITLIVEDGSGKADANSYASIETFREYWALMNIDYSDNTVKGQSDNDISSALIRATEYIDSLHFLGERRLTSQSLSFPRSSLVRPGASYIYPSYLPNDEVPDCIVKASCYMAGLIIQGRDIEAPTQHVSSQSVSGVGSVTYADGNGQWYFPKLQNLVGKLLNQSVPMIKVI
jgi:hypothetical protein